MVAPQGQLGAVASDFRFDRRADRLLRLSGIEYEHYMRQTQVIDFLLGLSVVALGYILHDQIYNIRGT